jgi:hypothetical protein
LDQPVLEGEGQRNAYALDPVLGPDGRFHLVWMWRDTPDCATNHTLSYARSRDLRHWENSRGEPIPLPITLTRAEIIDAAKPHEGLINMTFNLGFDAAQKPVVVYHRYDAAGQSQAYLARPANDAHPAAAGWLVQTLSTWKFKWAFSGGGSIPAEVTLGAPRLGADGFFTVDFSTTHGAAGRWRVRADTLERVAELPPLAPALPASLLRVASADPGLEVHSLVSRYAGRRYVLRWETLPRNRDLPRAAAPPPTPLRLYELPDAEESTATRVGS